MAYFECTCYLGHVISNHSKDDSFCRSDTQYEFDEKELKKKKELLQVFVKQIILVSDTFSKFHGMV